MAVSATGLQEVIGHLAVLPAALDADLLTTLRDRAQTAAGALATATPRGKTGDAQSGWTQEPTGPLEITVHNPVVSKRGFPYPGSLVTGTGARGVPTTGYSGGFRLDWPGMAPREPLHDVWEAQAIAPFALASIGLP